MDEGFEDMDEVGEMGMDGEYGMEGGGGGGTSGGCHSGGFGAPRHNSGFKTKTGKLVRDVTFFVLLEINSQGTFSHYIMCCIHVVKS